ncbi:hypothetical protein KOAAANKH_01913 [Brevundimonas sp. NIBR10]|uniref:hypothetical protein n=1 Tax=Brevundimonas sp. NIBR10 TaxID=3015997 RepID=UPI0022F1ABE2|nr:hypothetical protein [Brevundimonas sp. NIBR10]WGM47039.1 hypothetical protein KOAAANKH_01913 [Brevundimonas sp. NIBR10]
MIATVSQGLVVAAGVWLIGLGAFMLVRPRQALVALSRMGGSPGVHVGEMAVRILVGAAMVLAAAGSRYPLAVMVIGGFLIVSAVVLLVLPRRWHAAYSTWWASHIPVPAVRLIAPLSFVMGGALIWVVT